MIPIDSNCFKCGDRVEEPKITWGGFVKGQPHILVFHFDCYADFAERFRKSFDEMRKAVNESDKRPQG